ncbi:MAG: NAD(P)/FAD-dependent oxidoreductase [Halanaeroarchaeum sp.]
MDVIVIGGGIVGLASGYYLSRRGASVIVFEKESLGNGSTERSAGGIRRQFSTPVNVSLSKASVPVWEYFEETFGVDIEFRRNGYLFLARSAETADTFSDIVTMQNDLDVPTRLLARSAVADLVPALHGDRFEAGMYLDTDGFVDPHLALQGIAQSLPAGAELHTHTPVTDVLVTDGEVTGVIAGGERFEADFVVNAAGPWGRDVAQMAGIDLPAYPRRRRILVADPEIPIPETVPLVIDLDTGLYFRPEREGTALVGGHVGGSDDPDQNPDRFTETVGMEYTHSALETASEVAAYFGPETAVIRGWAGLYSLTPDRHPIIEETLPGFVSAIGFSGHGFQHGPAVGKLVTELVFDGEASLVDVSRLSSDRFDRGDLIEERNAV